MHARYSIIKMRHVTDLMAILGGRYSIMLTIFATLSTPEVSSINCIWSFIIMYSVQWNIMRLTCLVHLVLVETVELFMTSFSSQIIFVSPLLEDL
jgi:hypothetical protein